MGVRKFSGVTKLLSLIAVLFLLRYLFIRLLDASYSREVALSPVASNPHVPPLATLHRVSTNRPHQVEKDRNPVVDAKFLRNPDISNGFIKKTRYNNSGSSRPPPLRKERKRIYYKENDQALYSEHENFVSRTQLQWGTFVGLPHMPPRSRRTINREIMETFLECPVMPSLTSNSGNNTRRACADVRLSTQ